MIEDCARGASALLFVTSVSCWCPVGAGVQSGKKEGEERVCSDEGNAGLVAILCPAALGLSLGNSSDGFSNILPQRALPVLES